MLCWFKASLSSRLQSTDLMTYEHQAQPRHPAAPPHPASPRHPAAPPESEAGLLSSGSRGLLVAIAVLSVLYVVALALGWPQRETQMVLEEAAGVKHAAERPAPPPLLMVIPFVLMLGAIAVLPLWKKASHWWESNLHKFYVSAGLALVTVLYFA